mmetsp:Transcript_8092/g.16240  ORF Transcript_8092/g.16240 Transcript_8092/m.16240 type:complete len:112 (+) Transcript_8092:1717-2052(+)
MVSRSISSPNMGELIPQQGVCGEDDHLMVELMAAQRDAERMEEAVAHRDAVISKMSSLRRAEKEGFEETKDNLLAEVALLQGTIHKLRLRLQEEKKKNRELQRKCSKRYPM